MKQLHNSNEKALLVSASVLFLSLTLAVTPTYSRYLYSSSIDRAYTPAITQQEQTVNRDYLQTGGQTVWLAPWTYGSADASDVGEVEDKTYTFSLEAPQGVSVTATGSDYVAASATLENKTVSLTLSLTEKGKRLLTPQNTQIQVACGDTTATFRLWLLPVGTTIPRDADRISVDMNQICKKQTQGVHLQDGQAMILLDRTDQHAYLLTFLDGDRAMQGLRYSLDGGETYTQLHDWNQIYLPLQTATSTLMVLDYSQCGLTPESTPNIRVGRQQGQDDKMQTVSFLVVDTQPGETLPEYILLTPERSRELPLEWNGCDYEISLQRLEKSDVGVPYYQPIQTPAGLQITSGENGLTLSVQTDGEMPAAGTYQVQIQWKFEGVVCGKTTLPLFINYPFL